jgi:hypothetical protein
MIFLRSATLNKIYSTNQNVRLQITPQSSIKSKVSLRINSGICTLLLITNDCNKARPLSAQFECILASRRVENTHLGAILGSLMRRLAG